MTPENPLSLPVPEGDPPDKYRPSICPPDCPCRFCEYCGRKHGECVCLTSTPENVEEPNMTDRTAGDVGGNA